MNPFETLPWERRQPLMLLEARLIWTGTVAPADLEPAFSLTPEQARAAFEFYRQQAPDNLVAAKAGGYTAGERFEPRLLRGSAQEFLSVLRNFGARGAFSDTPLAVLAGGVAPFEVLERPEREFDVRILQRVVAAIREKRWLAVDYQSLTHPEPRRLQLAPHALACASRWHARAYSQAHDGYRDFLLARIRGLPELLGACAKNPADDWDWRNFVQVKLGAHPGLSPAQKQVVESDYGLQHGVYERAVRVALVPYYLQMLGLSRESSAASAAEQPLVLLNRAELDAYNRLS